ncbi:hypothetical protein FQ775_06255 [Nitratireductor mangrovi]|uniref:DUF1127 domain-containing protein n=1 Tax=Nitratireductor mangrovi TaxID=2599600 RepID=A0A5B8KWS7_9HYPH|nr:hypothetical protein [Nitratireductor mangrovi]QDZ00012.1 hypothetical protein FQ775_06255 [Nitratireductor mangrovi]
MNPFSRSLISAVGHFVTEWRALRDVARTERILGELSPHIRKDIGWPDVLRKSSPDGPVRH